MQSLNLPRWLDIITWRKPTVRTPWCGRGPLTSVMDPVWSLAFVFSLFVCTGCAAYTPPPLTPQHPAHPEAVAAPELPPSTTLAYGPSDIPAPQPAISLAQHTGHGAPSVAQQGQQSVVGEGRVIALVPGSNQVVVDHKEIKGFMDAMTMGYRIEPQSLLEGVKTGDSIRFTIDTQQKAIVKIEKMKE